MKLRVSKHNKFLFDYDIQEIDIHLLNQFPSIKKAMNGNTLELMNKIQGLDVLLGDEYKPKSILETCVGMGFSGHYFKYKFPKANIVLNEIKPELSEVLKKNFACTCFNCTSKKYIDSICYFDLIFIDFSDFTFCYRKNRQPIFNMINELSKKSDIIIMTGVYSYAASISKKLDINKYLHDSNILLNKFDLQITEIYIYENKKVELIKIEKIKYDKLYEIKFHYGISDYFLIHPYRGNEIFDF